MARGAYIGVGGTAKKIKKIYFGVGGVAKKVKKAYIGVGGVAKLWYKSDVVLDRTVASSGLTKPGNTGGGPTTTARTRGTVFNGYAILNDGGAWGACKAALYNSSLVKSSISLPKNQDVQRCGRLPSYAIIFGGEGATPYIVRVSRLNSSLTASLIYSGDPTEVGGYGEFDLSETTDYVIMFGGSTYEDEEGLYNNDGVNWFINNNLSINKTDLPSTKTQNVGTSSTSCSFGDKAMWLNADYSGRGAVVFTNSLTVEQHDATAIMGGRTTGHVTLNKVGDYIVCVGKAHVESDLYRIAAVNASLTHTNALSVPVRSYREWGGIAGVSTPEAVVFVGGGSYGNSSSTAITGAFAYDENLTLISAPALSRKATYMESSVWPVGNYGIVAGGYYSSGAPDGSGMSNLVEAYYEV